MEKLPAYWTLIIALIGPASALIGVYISNRSHENRLVQQLESENKSKEIEFKRHKLEELSLKFEKYQADIQGFFIFFTAAYFGHFSNKEALKAANEKNLQERGDYQALIVILNLFFPKLKPDFDSVLQSRKDAMLYCSTNDDFDRSKFPEFQKAQKKFDDSVKKFRESLRETAKELTDSE